MEQSPVTGITVSYNVALITVDNLPSKMNLISSIFNTIASQQINIDMISQSPTYKGSINISFSLPSDDLVKAISSLNSFKKDVPNLHVEVEANNAKLNVYGEKMKNVPGVAARLYTLLAGNDIEIKLVTTSEVDISYLIAEKDIDKAIESIKSEYNL